MATATLTFLWCGAIYFDQGTPDDWGGTTCFWGIVYLIGSGTASGTALLAWVSKEPKRIIAALAAVGAWIPFGVGLLLPR